VLAVSVDQLLLMRTGQKWAPPAARVLSSVTLLGETTPMRFWRGTLLHASNLPQGGGNAAAR